jgi:hypothetical protein
MINLDFRNLGQSTKLTFAHIVYGEDGKPRATLEEWMGLHKPHRAFNF